MATSRTQRRAGLVIRIDGQPVPAARPRVSRYGTYYPKTYAEYLERCRLAAAAQANVLSPTGHYTARVTAVVRRPQASKLTTPRGDVDNYAKGPLDGLASVGPWDDAQIVDLQVVKRWAEPGEDPHTLLHIFPTEGTPQCRHRPKRSSTISRSTGRSLPLKPPRSTSAATCRVASRT